MLKTEYKMEGLEAIQQKIDAIKASATNIESGESERGVKLGLRKAANHIRDQVKANAERLDDPNTPENIAANISVRWDGKHFRRTHDPKFRVGVRGGAKGYAKASGEMKGKGKDNPGGDTFYWRFIEFGTEKIPARPFLRPALRSGSQEAIKIFIENYKKSLDRSLRELSRNGYL